MTYSWRSHQVEFLSLCHAIARGDPRRHIIASVTPGGGKSALPVIAGGVLVPAVADRVCWVVPRQALQVQGAEAFDSPRFQSLLGQKMRVRAAGNESDPCRDAHGYVTTYQSLIADTKGHHRAAFEKHRYVLILDEPHHAPEGSDWAAALEPLVKRAAVLVQMSGTFQRHDYKPVAFLPYSNGGGAQIFDVAQVVGDKVVALHYPRKAALEERSIIPLEVRWFDLQATWMEGEEQRSLFSLAEAETAEEAKDGIHVALRTGAAEAILLAGYRDWVEYRQYNKRSKMLVVASTQALAESYLEALRKAGASRADIAVSKDSTAAHKNIARFKRHDGDRLDILVTVGMAYEGLDVPACTHVVCLTNIRSAPWIEQMATRATRVDYGADALPWEKQRAFLYCPDDPLMRECVGAIVDEQAAVADFPREPIEREESTSVDWGEEVKEPAPEIVPLESQALLSGASNLEGHWLSQKEIELLPALARVTASSEEFLRGLPVEVLKGQLQAYGPAIQAIMSDPLLKPAPRAAVAPPPTALPTLSEAEWRSKIHEATKAVDRACNWEPGRCNASIVRRFKRSRADMNAAQLAQVWAWLKDKFPSVVS